MRRLFGIGAGLLCLVLVTGMVPAQEEQTVYTSVSLWDVPRAKRGEFIRFVETNQAPVMRRLLDDGVIIEWGFDAAGLHDPNGYSHSTYFSAHSLADLEKVLDTYLESLGDRAEELEAELAGLLTKHEDYYARSSAYKARPVDLKTGYWIGSSFRVERGKGAEFTRFWEANSRPIYDQLLDDGTVASYSLSSSHFHTSKDSLGRYWVWYLVESLEDEAKVDAAFDEARGKLSEAERDARRDYFWSMVIDESHRDDFTRVIQHISR